MNEQKDKLLINLVEPGRIGRTAPTTAKTISQFSLRMGIVNCLALLSWMRLGPLIKIDGINFIEGAGWAAFEFFEFNKASGAGCLFFSFFSIQQSNSIKMFDWLQLNEEKKGRTAQPTKRSSNNINKPIQEIKIILIYWLELMSWTARLAAFTSSINNQKIFELLIGFRSGKKRNQLFFLYLIHLWESKKESWLFFL